MSFKAMVLAAALATPASAQDCRPASWLRLDGPTAVAAEASELLPELAQREVVLLGETHDQPDHHRWQLHTLAALHAQRPDMAIGFEMFPRRVQPVLDRWVAGELTAQQLLDQTEWDKVWRVPAKLYLPLFEFARIHRIPMLALNVERDLVSAIGRDGWDNVSEGRREGLSRPAPAPRAYLDDLFEVYREHRGGKGGAAPARTDPAFRNFVDAQQAWDRAMAEILARHAGHRLVVGIMGSGHLRGGHGVPLQLRDLGIRRIGTLLPLAAAQCSEAQPGLADAVFLLPATPPGSER